MYKYMYSLYSLHMYLVCRNDKCRACIMDQRCHTFSFGHYHQVPGASCSILYILVLSLVIFMQSLITWPARPAEPFWHATCIYLASRLASRIFPRMRIRIYIRGTRAKAGPGGAGDREARGSGEGYTASFPHPPTFSRACAYAAGSRDTRWRLDSWLVCMGRGAMDYCMQYTYVHSNIVSQPYFSPRACVSVRLDIHST